MTPEERARYNAWLQSHKPGSASDRERRRRDRETQEWLADFLNEGEKGGAAAVDVFS
jgi:hypothetical protein